MKEKLYIIKVGGNVIDEDSVLNATLSSFAKLEGKKMLIHGGGKLATRLAEQLGVQQEMIEGRRITDAETLKIVTMVYAGYINKQIVAKLQALGCNAFGLSGADGNAIKAHKRVHASIDYGWVGDVDAVSASLLNSLIEQETVPVIAPITHDSNGNLLNTNADTIAQEIAKAMTSIFDVQLVFTFDKAGVLLDKDDDSSLLSKIDKETFKQLKAENKIVAGMIPKLENAFSAIENGIKSVHLGKAEQLVELIKGDAGTTISNGN